jgi:hypothetical protein
MLMPHLSHRLPGSLLPTCSETALRFLLLKSQVELLQHVMLLMLLMMLMMLMLLMLLMLLMMLMCASSNHRSHQQLRPVMLSMPPE